MGYCRNPVTLSPKRAEIGIGTIEANPSSRGKGRVIADDAIKRILAKIDKIDLIDRDNDVTNAEQGANEGVTLRLDEHALFARR